MMGAFKHTPLTDMLGHLSELCYGAMVDSRSIRIADPEKEQYKIIADVLANAWAELSLRSNPEIVGPAKTLDMPTPLVTTSVKQLEAILEMVKANNTGDFNVHIMVANGMLTATQIIPELPNGGAEIHRSIAPDYSIINNK
jgi:hypothetical protein